MDTTMPPTMPPTPPPAMLSANSIATALRNAIKDYNYWEESEGDSPLVVRRVAKWGEEQLISADAGMRKKTGGEGYKVPEKEKRSVVYKTVDEVFGKLVNGAVEEVNTVKAAVPFSVDGMRRSAERLEYYTQLWSIFSGISGAKVAYVDYEADPYVGLFIYGQVEGTFIVCQACLVQT